MIKVIIASLAFVSAFAFASDGSDIPECKGVTDACMAANVTSKDSKTGKEVKGYQDGEHRRDGHGLWMDCVHKLAQGQPVEGLSQPVTAAAAKACGHAEHKAHPRKHKAK